MNRELTREQENRIEAEIQSSFKSTGYPKDDDLYGWKKNSGSWQAAWAGAYKRAAWNLIMLEEAQARIRELEQQLAKLQETR